MSAQPTRARISVRPFATAVLFATLSFPSEGRCSPPASATLQSKDAPLPAIAAHVGVLSNGLTYYLRRHPVPERQVHLTLVVKAGALHENADQQELAHFMEHMALKSTKHFPNVFADLAELGLPSGSGISASASDTSTRFDLVLPAGNPSLFHAGLQYLRDVAADVTFDPATIDAEREVMLGEFRTRQHYFTRLNSRFEPLLNPRIKSHFTLEDQIRRFRPESLLRFYRDWYRPDRMSLIVVGDIDEADARCEIKAMFSNLPRPERPSTSEDPSRTEPTRAGMFVIATDEEMPSVQVRLYSRQPVPGPRTAVDHKAWIAGEFYAAMMERRFWHLANQYHAPLDYALSGFAKMPIPALVTQATVDAETIQAGLTAVAAELERVRRFGFAEAELHRARERVIQVITRSRLADSAGLVSAYLRHFVAGEIPFDTEDLATLLRKTAQDFTSEEINAFARAWLDGEPNDLVILAPERIRPLLPDETAARVWIARAKAQQLEPYREPALPGDLLAGAKIEKLPEANPIVRKFPEAGLAELRLGNGAHVILKPFKPTGVNADRILLHGFSPGGASAYPGDVSLVALNAAAIVQHSGVGTWDKFMLAKYLMGKDTALMPYIWDTEEGVQGSSGLQDCETLLHLVYLFFTAPRKDVTAFHDWQKNHRQHLENLASDPQFGFNDAVNRQLDGRGLPLAAPGIRRLQEALGKSDLDLAHAIYRERFADAGDFIFVLTGNFDPEAVTRLVIKYLEALPDKGRRETFPRSPLRPVRGPVSHVLHPTHRIDGVFVELDFIGPYPGGPKDRAVLTSLCRILNVRLFDRLRSQEGGIYSVVAWPFYARNPDRYRIKIEFRCGPDGAKTLIAACVDEIERIKANGPDEETFRQAVTKQESSLKYHETQNDAVLVDLVRLYRDGDDPFELTQRIPALRALTRSDVQEGAKLYLASENLAQFIFSPK